ncbi:MAG: UDP-N-acetylmuramoyl-tripeptide--D-alanyl-D-alanine ligase [Planctomycetota bacterium]|jgi:UDP-N-acetylmuramoyl-tripeptide--D-alanyl-D-alanine ligase
MKEFSIETLAQIIKAEPTGNAKGFFTGVSTDSRTAQPGDCFFAIAGENFNGHRYVADAFAEGAVCAVVSKDVEGEKSSGRCVLEVGDSVKALGDFAAEYRRRMNFKVVAITGSVGKTTTRQIAYHVLRQHFRTSQAPKNFNNHIGLPLTLLGADPEDEIIIAEIGSNRPGEIAYLTRIARPDVAVITNVYPVHLEGFGSLQTIVQEKLSIAGGLQPDGILIINADFDSLVDACRAKNIEFITFGKSDAADIQVQNITHNQAGTTFTIDDSQLYLPLPGSGNVENALAAWAVCSRFGLTIDDFAHALKTLPAVPMRAELLQIGTLKVLNDCYNANPASMKNALDILANIGSAEKGRLVFVCGDMAELGEQSWQLHVELGRLIANANVQLLLAVGEFGQITVEAAKANAKHDPQTKCFEDTLSACNNLEEFIKDYDIILVKGSRVAGLEMVVEKLKELFSLSPSREAG